MLHRFFWLALLGAWSGTWAQPDYARATNRASVPRMDERGGALCRNALTGKSGGFILLILLLARKPVSEQNHRVMRRRPPDPVAVEQLQAFIEPLPTSPLCA